MAELRGTETLGDLAFQNFHSQVLPFFLGQVERTLPILGLQMEVRPSQDEQLDGLNVTVGRRGVERRIPASFPDVGLGAVFQQHPHDGRVPACHRRLQGRGVQPVVRRRVNGCACPDEIFRRLEMTKKAGQPQRLKSVICNGIHQFGVARQDAHKMGYPSGGGGFENVDRHNLVCQEIGHCRFEMVGGHQHGAESLLFGVNQARVQKKEALHFVDVPRAYGVKELTGHELDYTAESCTARRLDWSKIYPISRSSSMRNLFKKRQNIFIKLLHDQAALTLEGMDALSNYLATRNPEASNLLTAKEKEADEVRRIFIDELNRTFVTPFDREDLFALSRAIDDVVDYAYSTVSEMEILKVEPTTYMQRIATLLRDAAYELLLAVDRLEEHPGVSSEHAQRAKALENRVEGVYREALADLFSNVEDVQHVVSMLKMREVYRHLSNAADRGDEAANVIADVVVKIA